MITITRDPNDYDTCRIMLTYVVSVVSIEKDAYDLLFMGKYIFACMINNPTEASTLCVYWRKRAEHGMNARPIYQNVP